MQRSRLVLSILLALVSASFASDNEKRAPSGFQGVRGKKSIQDTYHENTMLETGNQMDKRVPSSGFMGMRGKKLYPERDDFPELPKRAPMGFLGMRGKKEYELNSFDDFDKRAPMGFLGMRGKKDDELVDDYTSFYQDKRAPSGFMGMRGKKEYSPFGDEEKRAPASGFFGMRGKKQPARSSFFGMRGKKYPYDMRGKFVGVRGKKDTNEISEMPTVNLIPDEVGSYMNDLSLNQLMFLLSQDDNDAINWEKRKGPSGFLGMRG